MLSGCVVLGPSVTGNGGCWWCVGLVEGCGREVVEVQGEIGGLVACGVCCREDIEEVGVEWELPDECGMGVEPGLPVLDVVVEGGQEVGVLWGLFGEVCQNFGNDGEWGVDIDGLVLGPIY